MNCIMTSVKKFCFFVFMILFMGCSKDWVDAKPDKALVVPSTIADLQAVIDNDMIMNSGYAALSDIGSDDYYVSFNNWQSDTNAQESNSYIWNAEIFANEPAFDWINLYQRVFYCNVALEGIEKIKPNPNELTSWNNVKGSALFFRAFSFFEIAQLFAPVYNAGTAGTDPGIVLKLSPDVNQPVTRASNKESYERIVQDLILAKSLLPIIPSYKTRPSQPAVSALLSRVYLSMGLYQEALAEANNCLQQYNSLIDYNTLTLTAARPFSLFNSEVIFHSTMAAYSILQLSTRAKVDTILYRSYNDNDLRKRAFFTASAPDNIVFKGNYTGGIGRFGGLSVNEVFLNRAEAYARIGQTQAAMNDLNTLLSKRWRTGFFTNLTASDANQALQIIVRERKKELLFRGLRWNDLRRLNRDNNLSITITRNLNGTTYQLSPNDPKYVYPIPQDEVRLNGLKQNPR